MMIKSLLTATCLLLSIVQAVEPPRRPHQPLGNGTLLLTFNETVPSAVLSATSTSFNWLAGGEDGQYITLADDGSLVFQNVVTGDSRVFVAADQIPKDYWEYTISPDLTRVLWATNYTKQYRYSYFADYLILDVASGELTPLVNDQVGDIQYAAFAPVGDVIAFVRGNNLFLHNNSEVTQVTYDGSPDQFNAVPDWVYEEEIFGDRKTLWFSPDAQFMAFLSFNETGVGTFTIPYYMDDQPVAPPYPRELELRYPKVGTTNPTVAFNILEVATAEYSSVPIDAFAPNDTIVGEVAWLTDDHSNVIYRVFNRVQDLDKHVLVDPVTKGSVVIRQRDGRDGWLDDTISISYIGSIESNTTTSNETYYVDVSDESGWNHLYLFPVHGGDAIPLTSGEWEVVSILTIDTNRSLIYYTSTEHHSTERHIYSVSYVTLEKTPIVDDTVSAYWSASFSSGGSYYLLSYLGPDVPYQELYSVNSSTPIETVTNNTALYEKIMDYKLPNVTYFELQHPDGYSLNVMQRLPANFSPNKTYPVLFTPYGGPGAQEVSKRFQTLTWRAYIASDPELEYITYTVDNRGTGFKGRAFRATVTGHLGRLEPLDQIWAAEQLIAQNAFIDADKVGIWGWSFGGYLSAKVVEADSGVFTMGLITAPVTDWRLYDSMYTERYMKLPEQNEAGYNETAVRNATGFKNIEGGFAIMHGTGDDNVHYQNSAALIDLLVGSGVSPSKMKMMAFTDSDHRIVYHGATRYIYRFLTARLWDEKQRVPDTVLTHQWSRRKSQKDKVIEE